MILKALSSESSRAREVEQGLAWARKAKHWKELRPLYERRYEGKRISNAVEVLSAEGLYQACINEMQKIRRAVSEIDSMTDE